MPIVEHHHENFSVSTDKSRLDIDLVHEYLSQSSYWAQGRPFDVTQKSIEHSFCFGVYDGDWQVGFARVVTDYVTFAWLCDVFILESHRGHGLGKWMIECIVACPNLKGIKNFLLATRDAHELYRGYGGFESLEKPEKWMARTKRPATDPPAAE
ncbi:MAG: GNAT family N-acetyltransferase [Chloroflexi bacterium]|nr:GNAT family N-acetyltransferase [Chloroflexota bacterium]